MQTKFVVILNLLCLIIINELFFKSIVLAFNAQLPLRNQILRFPLFLPPCFHFKRFFETVVLSLQQLQYGNSPFAGLVTSRFPHSMQTSG